MTGSVVRMARVGARVGEAPLWLPDRKVWLWLDLQGRTVHRYDPVTATDRVIASGFAEDLACLARCTEGAALLVSVRGFHRLDPDSGQTAPLPCPVGLPPGTIFNDGKVDRHGGLWLGSSDAAEAAPLGRLWHIRAGQVTEVAAGFTVSNGPAFAPDGTAAYFADTIARRILRFRLDTSGAPTVRARFTSATGTVRGSADGPPAAPPCRRSRYLHAMSPRWPSAATGCARRRSPPRPSFPARRAVRFLAGTAIFWPYEAGCPVWPNRCWPAVLQAGGWRNPDRPLCRLLCARRVPRRARSRPVPPGGGFGDGPRLFPGPIRAVHAPLCKAAVSGRTAAPRCPLARRGPHRP